MDRPILYFFHHPECAECKICEPVIDAWAKDHPFTPVIKLSTQYVAWKKFGFKPKGTPAYLYVRNDQPRIHFEGGLRKITQIDKLIAAGNGEAK